MWYFPIIKNVVTQSEKAAIIVECAESRREITYKQLGKEVCSWRNFFLSKSIQAGDRVVLHARNTSHHISSLIALNSLGAALVPMNFRLSLEEKKEIIKRVVPRIIVSSAEFIKETFDSHLVESLESTVDSFIEFSEDILKSHLESLSKSNFSASTICKILFTSGSSGRPKGVMFQNSMINTNNRETVKNWKLASDDICLVETPFFHTGGYNVLALPLLSIGGGVIIRDKFEPLETLYSIVNNKVSVYFGVPTMFQCLFETLSNSSSQSNMNYLKSIRFFISGGAAISKELVQMYQANNISFKQGFGMTEIGPNCFLLDEEFAISKCGSIGKPMSHTRWRVLNELGLPCKANETGELQLKGDHLCSGYLSESILFESSLSDGYFKSGDLVQFDEDGFFYVVGRLKDMFISGGENVYPAEVERAIYTLNMFQECAVVSTEHEKWGEVGVCFFRRHPDTVPASLKFQRESYKEQLSKVLSRYKIPQSWFELESLPLLANGKIDRKALEVIARNQNTKEMEQHNERL